MAKMIKVATQAERLKTALELRSMTQAELARQTGILPSSISQWLHGKYEGKQDSIYAAAKALDISEPWLMGLDAPMERGIAAQEPLPHPSLRPIRKRRIPLLGSVAAGVPIFADEDHEAFVLADEDLRCDFALTVSGDSMEPRLYSGDIVFVRKQDDVEDGEIAVVLIDDDATLKHVYHLEGRRGLHLMSDNPKYAPMVYTRKNCETLRILGKAVAYQRAL